MKILFRSLALLLVLLLADRTHASHIAGAELVYSCSGPGVYLIQLKMYRDCLNSETPYDDPLLLYIFRGNGTVYSTYQLRAPSYKPEIIPENWDACIATPYNICLQEGAYELTVNLPPITGGYNIAWTRCCRNDVITNLERPICQGITFLAHVPEPQEAICNSMPVFNKRPSIFLCAGETYYFDHSASDTDGDSLVYSLTHPYTGTNFQGLGTGNDTCGSPLLPRLGDGNEMGPPPYDGVLFALGYNAGNPFGPGGYARINPSTGYLEAFPANNGIYVMAVSVKEYRNGILLSENKRDFQFHVLSCRPQGPPPILSNNLLGSNVIHDTIFTFAGKPFCYEFTVGDSSPASSIQVTPLSVSFGGNGGFPPPYATIQVNGTTPPVTGQVCWKPSCSYSNALVPMIISARDINDCPNYNIVFDTVWVRVIPPVAAPPTVNITPSGLPMIGDTIVLPVQNSFCFDFTVVDTTGDGKLVGQCTLQDTLGNMLGQVHSVTMRQVGDTIFGQVCWETFCNYGNVYMFVVQGTDDYRCPPGNVSRDTIYLRVPTPYNPPPLLNTDISQNPTNSDTILANVNESFCFDISVVDTAIGAGLAIDFSVMAYDQNWLPILNNPFIVDVTGGSDSIGGEICWRPQCAQVDQMVHIVVQGDQTNPCSLHRSVSDTIHVRVSEPFRPAPVISHDLGSGSPDNQLLNVSNNEVFCFTFMLQDTVTPTNVQYSLNVFDANGAPFVGSLPNLTFTIQSDSLLAGSICWTVPCALTNQQFKIKMTGRDSLDCHSSNTVYDSVMVSHTETPPSSLRLCNATVGDDDASIQLSWEADVENDVVGFKVYRRRDGERVFTVHDSIFNLTDRTYIDIHNVQPDSHSYCFRMTVMDRCGNESPMSDEICTILLHASQKGYTSLLNWTKFVRWGTDPLQYNLWKGSPIPDGFPPAFLQSVDPHVLSFVDLVVNKAWLCYRIIAIPDGGGCAEPSQSNEACVIFSPTLYMPTAFTPNGDGLNDYFSAVGEFVETSSLEIYDRWGKLLFRSTNLNEGWDGSVDGQPAPEGGYVYKVKIVGYNGDTFAKEGSITLVR